MNNRERFRAAMAFEPTDRPCHIEHGFWQETRARWLTEGLSPQIHPSVLEYLGPQPDLYQHFGVTRYGYILRGQYLCPPEPPLVLEETDEHLLTRDELGRTVKTSKTSISLPHFVDHAVKTRSDYEALRERLQPDVPQRYPADWPQLARRMREQQDALVCTHMDGFFAFPRELMGAEQAITVFYTEPELARQMINERVEFYMTLYEQAIRDTQPDFAFIWEDMCFSYGPLVSPEIFAEFMQPAYRRLTDYFRSLGVDTIIVDSDGDISLLIPLWLDAGVTGLLPFEVKAGMDVVRLGEEFPTLQIIGGINKHALEVSPAAIDAEVDRVVPAMLKRGGYAVALDHWVHPEIPLANYQHFVERVRSCTPSQALLHA